MNESSFIEKNETPSHNDTPTLTRENISRRELLKTASSITAASLIKKAFPSFYMMTESAHTENSEVIMPELDKEKAAKLAITASEALNEIIPTSPIIETIEDAIKFQRDFIPYLSKVGYRNETMLIYPEMMQFDFAEAGGELSSHFSLGRTQCQRTGAIFSDPAQVKINANFFEKDHRLNDPERNPLLGASIAHEACHANELSCTNSDYVEAIAQLASTNTLFAMAQDGEPHALPAALYQIQDMAKSYYLTELIREGNIDEYYNFLSRLPNANKEVEEWNFVQSFWQDQPEMFDAYVRGVTYYGRMPYEILTHAIKNPTFETSLLPSPYQKLSMKNSFQILSDLPNAVAEYLSNRTFL